MITTSVKTSGARWAEVEEKVQQAVAGAVRETAVEIADRARALAPVRTGHLRDSIEATETGPYEWDVAANADYAQFVELGTSRMAPNRSSSPLPNRPAPASFSGWLPRSGRRSANVDHERTAGHRPLPLRAPNGRVGSRRRSSAIECSRRWPPKARLPRSLCSRSSLPAMSTLTAPVSGVIYRGDLPNRRCQSGRWSRYGRIGRGCF
jgi:hypothetical protein